MELLNDRVTPKILTRYVRTTNPGKYSIVTYHAQASGKLLDPLTLTAQQKGHFYQWKELPNGRITVHMPYVCMNVATATLLKGLRSFHVEGDRVFNNRVYDTKSVTCIHDFSLDKVEFSLFSARIRSKKFNGIIEKDYINTKELTRELEDLRKQIPILLEQVSRYRHAWCRDPGVYEIKDDNTLSQVLCELRDYKNRRDNLDALRIIVAKKLDKLARSPNQRLEYVVAQSSFDRITDALNALEVLDFDRYEREAVHKLRVTCLGSDPGRPEYLGTLAEELGSLKRLFPALQRIYTVQEDILVDLPGNVRIYLLRDGSARIEGDLEGQRHLIEATTSTKPDGRRRRAILTETESEETGGAV